MNIKNNIITVVVDSSSVNFKDGIYGIENKIGSSHLEKLKEVAVKLKIPEIINNELEMIKIVARYGHAIILNYGNSNEKQSCLMMLPMQLTEE